jgi:alkylation response protein AidB-like acyl-CoA dehydrogenase
MMNHETALSQAKEIADRVLAPAARQNDKEGRFSTEAVHSLGQVGLLGLTLPTEFGGAGLGPRTFAAVLATLAEADASVAMVYLMHICASATIAAARPGSAAAQILKEIASGGHLSTLAFSEAGSRSHFWAPVSRARLNGTGVGITAKKSWVTSAGYAQSYVVSSLAPEGTGPTDSTLYLVPAGVRGLSVEGSWDGLGLRANASAPMVLNDCEVPGELQLTDDGAGFQAMLNVVLPQFNLGTASVALGLCRAAVAATAAHLKSSRFEHLGQSLGESLPTLRAQLATMQIDTDGLSARVDDLVDHLERPRDTTMLRVLETKAAAGDLAIGVTSTAMRVCGGAAFSKHLIIERVWRDAHAGAVMAPTGDVLREFIARAVLGMPLF